MFLEHRISVLQDENSFGDGWLFNNVNYLLPRNPTLTVVNTVHFMCIFYNKNRQRDYGSGPKMLTIASIRG
jgi:hypothetical protein